MSISGTAKEFLSREVVDFLEKRHTEKVDRKFQNKATTEVLKPVETFELEVKNNMSNASHELLQAINRVEDCRKQNTELDTADYLRYARLNLEEAGKDMEAAELAYKALETYHKRVEKASAVLAHELEAAMLEIFDKLEHMKNLQRNLFEKVVVLINEVRSE